MRRTRWNGYDHDYDDNHHGRTHGNEYVSNDDNDVVGRWNDDHGDDYDDDEHGNHDYDDGGILVAAEVAEHAARRQAEGR